MRSEFLTVTLILIVVGALIAWRQRPAAVAKRRRRAALRAWERDRALASYWLHLQETCRASAHLHIAHVSQVYGSYPRRGTKAYITWLGIGHWVQDTWFESAWPAQGSWVVVSGSTGYGPHNHNPRVFYVEQIHAIAPAGSLEAWNRCTERGWQPPEE